jgi:hypothetical protein
MSPRNIPVKPVVPIFLFIAILIAPAVAGGHWDRITVDTGSASDNTDGLYTSITLDRNNVPHASWVNEAKGQVEYGTFRNNRWTIERVGPIDHPALGRLTYYTFTTSIALDPQENPAISYAGIEGHLYFAHRENGTWTVTDIAGSDTLKHQWSCLKYDPAGRPHIAFTTKTYIAGPPPVWGTIPLASHLSWAWQKDDKTWQIDTIDNPQDDVGYEPSLAIDRNNRATVAYRTGYNPDIDFYSPHRPDKHPKEYLKIARQDRNGSWDVFMPGFSCSGDEKCGFLPSLALDSRGDAHIVHSAAVFGEVSYQNESHLKVATYYTNRVLNHLDTDLSINHWIQSWEVKEYDWNGWTKPAGDYTDAAWDSLALDSSDKTHVSYYDPVEKHLKYSFNDGDPVTVDDSGNAGRCNAIAVDSGGNPWIIYHDDTNNAVRVARWVPE